MSPEELFNEYQHLANATIYRIYPDPYGICRQNKIEMSDLKQYALEGLWRGCLNYNEDKGTQIKTHLINSIRWNVLEKIKRETSLIKYDSNKYNSIEKFGLISIDAEVLDSAKEGIPRTFHDVIPSDTDVQSSAIGEIYGERMLSKLSDTQKDIIVLMEKGLNSNDIGNLYGVTGANVRYHFKQAKKRLENYHSEVV